MDTWSISFRLPCWRCDPLLCTGFNKEPFPFGDGFSVVKGAGNGFGDAGFGLRFEFGICCQVHSNVRLLLRGFSDQIYVSHMLIDRHAVPTARQLCRHSHHRQAHRQRLQRGIPTVELGNVEVHVDTCHGRQKTLMCLGCYKPNSVDDLRN